MISKVFISYRRDDSAGHAGRVYDRLKHKLGADLLFMDVDGIPLGVNFVKVLDEEVAKCNVLLAIIGRGWLDASDEEGHRRLDDPHDFVRVEIAAALKRDIPVIPILLEGTRIPKAQQLPDDLKELALRNALDVRHASFDTDMEKLIQGLKAQADQLHGPEMVVVPAGNYIMGSPENEAMRESWQEGTEGPQHKVTIERPFAVARHVITRGQFAHFVKNANYDTEGGALVWTGTEWKHDPNASWRSPGFRQDDSHPAVCVNWNDANAYAAWLSGQSRMNYRILTEAEWEYVARAGTTTPFWWGSSISTAQANYDGNYTYAAGDTQGEYRQSTVPVVSFAANPWGLFNVHGNVWEWCQDPWHDNYNGAPSDGSSWLQGGYPSLRVVRGGSWNAGPHFLRSALRQRRNAGTRCFNQGFRLARTL